MAEVKIRLVMKNGEKAKDMESLRENFDVESVIGYFLDGKLVKWLNDRYYEEEAEAVAQLDKSDANLPEKLCEIFGVNYSVGEEIDPEEIVRRKERLSRLKQLTDDESVLGEVDLVAFDQEELAELYDRGAEKIYLCEGTFQIPKSKQDLEYIPLAGAQVSGLKERELSAQAQTVEGASGAAFGAEEYVIPLEVADKINCFPYAVLQDYIVFMDAESFFGWGKEGSGLFHVWNKYSGTETTFSVEGIQTKAQMEICAADGNRLLIAYDGRKILLYDVELKTIQVICEDADAGTGEHYMSYKNGLLAYQRPGHNIQILNIQAEEILPIRQIEAASLFKFGFAGDFLIYAHDLKVKLYNMKMDKTIDIMYFGQGYTLQDPPIEVGNRAYMAVIDSMRTWELVSIDLNAPELPPQKHISGYRGFWMGIVRSNAPYILSRREGKDYALDLRTLTEKEIAITDSTGTGAIAQNIGDYLYFWNSVTESIQRVYLPDLKAEPVEITES